MRWNLGSVLLAVMLLTGLGAEARGQDGGLAGDVGQDKAQDKTQDKTQDRAQDGGPQDRAAAEPPGGVVRAARLTYVSGAVTLQKVDNTGEDAPVVNTPLYAGTRIVTGDYGQAEVEFEDGSVVRVTPRSALSLDVLGLDGSATASDLTLLSGLAYFELRKTAVSAYRVTAGGVVAMPVENSTVRVSLDDGPAVFAVLTGSERVDRDGGFSTVVRAGESLRADGKDESRYYLSDGLAEQSWDRWNEERDAAAADEADRRTTARDGFAGAQGYGWSDLDAHGTWYDVPGQGMVWQPDVADEGFDPYGYGDWVYGNTGYVFVSGYSWGWTPFRCGRWGWYAGFGWVWAPGASCGSYGFGAGGWEGDGGVRVGHGPPRYKTIRRPIPIPGPGGVHPVVKVLGPDGPRPPVHTGGPGKVAGVQVTPLRPVGGGGPRSGSMVGQALNRDYPVDRKTGSPVLGVGGVVRPISNETVGGTVWKPEEGKGRTGRATAPGDRERGVEEHRTDPEVGSGTVVGTTGAGSQAGSGSESGSKAGTGNHSGAAPLRGSPGVERGGTVRVPVAAAPVRAAPPTPAPLRAAPSQPAPVRSAPAPSPAPARAAPAPAAPAPAAVQSKPK